MTQTPAPESFILKWRGDTLAVTLELGAPRRGRAAFRTNLGRAAVRRREIIEETELGLTPLARAWTDIPMDETAPGRFQAEIPLEEVGIFSGKACFFPEGSHVPEWPEGRNLHVKVESAEARRCNSIYCVFPRQFGSFREVIRRLDTIMDRMGFRIIQVLPPFPVPTTYAAMGEYGSPFAATDFLSVDPSLAEFDTSTTPLDQFLELVDAVHAHGGRFFIDLPANHTGWASTLQTHHPDWFHRRPDGPFVSPGAWGVTWADLVELDYSNPALRAYMADVFLFWCRHGADGFRCDAGYMIPLETWAYIVAKVRDEYPDTVFLLEGLGGKLETTDALLAEANLDWAYSEIFQTYDRRQFEWYLPQAIARSEKFGTLVHFAETHDNDRLAKGGEAYARLRVQLAALLSWQGAWGIANGVEWYCREKIDVHAKNGLDWGASHNMVDLIARLNRLLAKSPAFAGENHLELVTEGGGNTLAVLRDGLLVVANLDVEKPVRARWNRAKFDAPAGYDYLTGRTLDTGDGIDLGPGEVVCLLPKPDLSENGEVFLRQTGDQWQLKLARRDSRFVLRPSLFHWEFPRDVRRAIAVPAGEWVQVSAACPFRAQLRDPATGRTLRVFYSRTIGENAYAVRFDAPAYEGDGTRCRALDLFFIAYQGGNRSRRTHSAFLVPPPGDRAAVRVQMDGAAVRAAPADRTVLSNGAGAAAQVRLGWGRIESQYDALLAANPDPAVPSDRLNVWTRARCWLQREGYSRELDDKCVSSLTADPSGKGARWDFIAPCGLGRTASFTFELSLAEGENAARLRVTRGAGGPEDVGDSVRLVFRPDLEWRSFHATTKAFQGAEGLFPAAVSEISESGFVFAPYEGAFRLSVSGGVYHHEPQWTYGVGHAEEAARGQEPSGDLFSPGWVSADLGCGETLTLIGAYARPGEETAGRERTWGVENFPAVATMSVPEALRRALDLYVVRRDDLKTVIAGYPWFLDWGRDTFIFLRGLLAAGRRAEAAKILKAFAAFEERGTLPNIIHGKTAGNRDTTDAQLWFIRCVEELGSPASDALLPTCRAIVENYIAGTPNGIRVDPESGLVWSPSHFTWMDTNYPACTPRVGYPIEIQALWISALKFLGRTELAARALESVKTLFRMRPRGYCDCLAAPNGEPAARATPEDTVRPNQLFLITLGVLEDPEILRATEELLVPGGIRSLNAGHPLYRGTYAGDEDTSRKPAYHNGTVWAWPFPLYAEALVRTNSCTPETALALLGSSVENLNSGCLCHVSENADGDAPHAQKGCTAQAWSDSELLRVWLWLETRGDPAAK